MDFLIFSDSHGKQDRIREAVRRQIRRPDAVFFLGDGLRDVSAADFGGASLYAVRGNCDWYISMGANSSVPMEMTATFEGHKILLTHGHAYNVKSGYGALIAYAAKVGADIVLFGHTHEPYAETIPAGSEVGGTILTRPLYLFNPGSVGMEGSFGTLTLRGDTVLFSHGRLQ